MVMARTKGKSRRVLSRARVPVTLFLARLGVAVSVTLLNGKPYNSAQLFRLGYKRGPFFALLPPSIATPSSITGDLLTKLPTTDTSTSKLHHGKRDMANRG